MGLLLFGACTTELQEVDIKTDASGNIMTKVVNTSDSSVQGMLMVKTTDDGVLTLDGLDIPSLAISDIEPMFKITAKNADRMAAYGLDKWYVIKFDQSVSLHTAAQSLVESPKIEKIQFNKRVRRHDSPVPSIPTAPSAGIPDYSDVDFNDPMLAAQWHYNNIGSAALTATARQGADINVKDAWKLTAGDPSVVVAVIDEGVQYNHPDLAANMWVNTGEIPGNGSDDDGNGYVDDVYGYNFVEVIGGENTGEITWDNEGDSGHGTHVAGTVAAVNNNGIGVCGVAGGSGNGDGARIMGCQIFDGEFGGDDLAAARAIFYASDMGADIIQCSWGSDAKTFMTDREFKNSCPVLATAIDYFVDNGGLAIFSAGNNAADYSGYPGAYSKCISVTSIGPDYLPAYYTNYGPGSSIAAPGGDAKLNAEGLTQVLSTIPAKYSADGSGYEYMQGTSMASPHVSGVAALGLSYAKKLGKTYTNTEFRDLLLTSVNDLEHMLDGEKSGMSLYKYHGGMGTGLIDAWKLLMNIEGTPCLMAPVGVETFLDLSPVIGGSAEAHPLLEVTLDDEAREVLGVEGELDVQYGKLKIKCTKTGSAKAVVKMISEYKEYETAEGVTAGDVVVVTKEISILSRGVVSSNGGWL